MSSPVSKKDQKNNEKEEKKLLNWTNQIEMVSKERVEDVNQPSIRLHFEQKDIPQHCILRADSQDNTIITLDGWNQGFNNLIVWDAQEYTELQRISFPKSAKLSDVCFVKCIKNTFIVGGDDKHFRIYSNTSQEDGKINYQELFSLKIKNKISCLKYINDDTLMVGTKNGPLHELKLKNILNFISYKTCTLNKSDEEKSEKVDITVEQKDINLHERKINDIFIFSDSYLFTISEDKSFIAYNFQESSIFQKVTQSSCIRSGYLDEPKNRFYTGNTAGEIYIYSLTTNNENKLTSAQEIKKLEVGVYIYQILPLEEESLLLYSTNKKKWFLHDIQKNIVLQESHLYNDYISVLHLLPNKRIFLGEGKNIFQIWDQPTINNKNKTLLSSSNSS